MISVKRLACPTTLKIKLSFTNDTFMLDSTEYKHVIGALQYCTHYTFIYFLYSKSVMVIYV